MSQITRFDASEFPTTFAAQIKDFDNEGCAAHPACLAGAAVRRRCAAAAGLLRSALMVTACTSLALRAIRPANCPPWRQRFSTAGEQVHGCFAPRLIDKKNARRYDDCISYSLVSAKKALKSAGLCQDDNPDAVAKLDKTRAGVRGAWSRALDMTCRSHAWCAVLRRCPSSAERVSFGVVHTHSGHVQDMHIQVMLWRRRRSDAGRCHNAVCSPGSCMRPGGGRGALRAARRRADRVGHGRAHHLPGRRQEPGGEGLQEDHALLHPLRHHQHVRPRPAPRAAVARKNGFFGWRVRWQFRTWRRCQSPGALQACRHARSCRSRSR